MKRSKFIGSLSALALLAAAPLPSLAGKRPPGKAFRVKALESRYPNKIRYGNTPIDFKLLSTDTGDRLSVFISSNNLPGGGPPLHFHQHADEYFCVLQGRFLYQLDDERLELEPGDSLFIPRGVRHAFDCIGTEPGTLLVAITPGKGMEAFFAGMAPILNKGGVPDMAAMQALYRRYDSEIVGPPVR